MTWATLIRTTLAAAGLAVLGITLGVPTPASADPPCATQGVYCDSGCNKICEDEEGNEYCCGWWYTFKPEPQ